MFSEGQLAAGRYIVQAKLAEGHLGPVFRGVDVQTHNVVALRPIVLSPAGAEVLERDLREIASLGHPNIISCELHLADDHQPFLTGELIDGKPLDALIRDEGPVALPRACSLARQIASALEAAHHAGVIHGDLKPSSVLVMGGPDEEIIKVCGFGTYSLKKDRFVSLVRLAIPHDGELLFGLPEYIAPEQALGTSGDALDGRSDLYSLGVILYQMLTGAAPHLGASAIETLLAKIFAPPPLFASELEIPLVLQTLLTRCLAKRRDDRPASATVIADQLAAWAREEGSTAVATSSQPEPVRSTEVETGNAPLVTDTILASARVNDLEEEPSAEPARLAELPVELSPRDSAEFVPDLQPSATPESRAGVSPPLSLAPDVSIELDVAGSTARSMASRGLEADLEPVAADQEPRQPANEADGAADTLDVRLDAPETAVEPERAAEIPPPQPFFRPAAAGATIFGNFQPKPKRRRLRALRVAAIVILIIVASGCGWLYYTGRTYWFDPSYVRMRITTYFAGSPPTSQVQTDAYSQSANPTTPAQKPVSTPLATASAETSGGASQPAQPPEPGAPGKPEGQPSNSTSARRDTVAQATVPNSTPLVIPSQAHALQAKPAAARMVAYPAGKRTNQGAESAQNIANDVAAAVTRGDYYFDRGDYDAAIRAYEDGLAHAPGNQELGSAIARARKAQAAEAKYLQ